MHYKVGREFRFKATVSRGVLCLVPELLLRCAPAVMFGVESVQHLLQVLIRLSLGRSRGGERTLKISKFHLYTDTECRQ